MFTLLFAGSACPTFAQGDPDFRKDLTIFVMGDSIPSVEVGRPQSFILITERNPGPQYVLNRSQENGSPYAPGDEWLAEDKVKHVVVSALWTVSTQYVLVDKAGLSAPQATPVSLVSGASIGLAKEVYDWKVGPSKTFSGRDLVADGLGVLLGLGLIVL